MDRCNAFKGQYPVAAWTCPPWLLQELGYALALGKRLVLFRELSVEIAGLQGDLEYIDFDPSNPTSAIHHANEMINSVIAALRGISVNTSIEAVQAPPAPSQTESPMVDKLEKQSEREGSENTDTLKEWLVKALLEKDWKQFDELLRQYEKEDLNSALFYHALSLYNRYNDGDAEAFDDLKKLYAANPTHVGVALCTAKCFNKFGQYDQAVEHLKRSANHSNNVANKRDLIGEAVRTLKHAKQFGRAREMMLTLFSESTEHLTGEALELFSEVLREYGDINAAVAIGELALEKAPANSALRFRVGLDYHSVKQWNLFLWQYIYYCKDTKDSGGLHNLALAYSNCELPIHSVQNYQQAFELGNMLSASALTYKYLDAGLATEARDLLKGALTKFPESAPNVGGALSEIADRQEEEDKKEERLLDEAATMRKFMLVFGDAFLTSSTLTPSGTWEFLFGEIELHVEGGSIVGEVVLEKDELLLSLAAIGAPRGVTTRYSFKGTMTGLCCKFTVYEGPVRESEEPHRRPRTILGGLESTRKTEGYIVFQNDMQHAQVMEIEGDNWKNPYRIDRVHNS